MAGTHWVMIYRAEREDSDTSARPVAVPVCLALSVALHVALLVVLGRLVFRSVGNDPAAAATAYPVALEPPRPRETLLAEQMRAALPQPAPQDLRRLLADRAAALQPPAPSVRLPLPDLAPQEPRPRRDETLLQAPELAPPPDPAAAAELAPAQPPAAASAVVRLAAPVPLATAEGPAGSPEALKRERPPYPPQAQAAGREGAVFVEFTVRTDGSVADVTVLSAEPDATFVEPTLQAVRLWRFRPATRNGKPVAVRVRQKVSFRLEPEP